MTDPKTAWARVGRIACALAIALYVVVLLRTAWMSDDAYITLRTVDNFVNGHGLRWNVDERVQSFTHPLWLFMIAIPYLVTREAFYTTTVVSLLLSITAVLTLVVHRRRDPWAGVIVLTALLFSKCFVDYSTSGLENPLTHVLLAWFVILLPREATSNRRLWLLSLVAGLSLLARTDNLLLFGPGLALALVRHGRWRRGVSLLLAGMAPALVWHLFSTVYYGIPYPNTALAKLNTGIPFAELAQQGWRYLANSLRLDPLTLLLTACGVAAAAATRRARSIALGAGVVLYLVYVVRIGGDFMSGRFLTAPFFLSVALMSELEWSASRWLRPAAIAAIAAAGFAAPYPTVLCGRDYGMRLTEAVDENGIADERRYYFAQSGLFGGQPGFSRPLAQTWRAGRELREAGVSVTVEGAVGFLGYRAGPYVHIVDYHALCDPLLSRLPAVRHDPFYVGFLESFQYPTSGKDWRPGHFLRSVPGGYLRSLATGTNSIDDPAIASLYDDTRLVTRGRIWDTKRLATIARLLARGAPQGAQRSRPEFSPVPWDELVLADPGNADARYWRGITRQQAGHASGAMDDYLEAVKLDPRNGRALVAAANALGDRGRWDEGLALVDQAVAVDAGDAEAWRYRALMLEGQKRYRDAIEALLKAAQLDPRLAADMYANVGLEHAKLKENDQAVSWLRRAEALDPRLSRTSLILGKVFAMQGRPKDAIAAFERALELEPTLARAALDLATVHAEAGDREAALRVLDRFSRGSPQNAEVYYLEGKILDAQGRRSLAVERFRAAAALGHAGARAALRE
jgi:arabinofuranosyltransferase